MTIKKKDSDRYGLSLSMSDFRTRKTSHIAIQITNPTLRLILAQEKRNHEKSNTEN